MLCPRCKSDELLAKRRIGFEEFIRLFTDRPKYLCQRCRFKFRPATKAEANPKREHAWQKITIPPVTVKRWVVGLLGPR